MTVDPFQSSRSADLDPEIMRSRIRLFLDEDVGSGDITTARVVPPSARAHGAIVARQPCIVAGLEVARMVFHELDSTVTVGAVAADGRWVNAGAAIARLHGKAAPILAGERLALNLLQRLSGIATLTDRYVDALAGTSVSVSDTRKTTPGLRLFEKYAVRVGGGRNHRMGLYDAILIKDNHIAAAGGLTPALKAAKAAQGNETIPHPIQVEITSLAQVAEALAIGVDAVLLDNMSPKETADAVRAIRAHPGGAACWIEASGGITLENIRAYAQAGVDTISVGALTHSAPAVDIALDLDVVPDRD
jgi:nicotinate-nucleotide pyrophosphorylase (carboxylating)